MIVFDIETMPFPEEQLRTLYQKPTYEEFAVSCDQRWKDETKQKKFEEAKETGWQKFVERAALRPTTGRVLAIGYYSVAKDKVQVDHLPDNPNQPGVVATCPDNHEARLLANFWRAFEAAARQSRSMVGVNIFEFDLPFLARRSWMLNVEVPHEAWDGKWWHRAFVDLSRRWLCGQRFGSEPASFDTLAAALRTQGKPEGMNGGDFHRVWSEDREAALAYLANDVRQPAIWAERMGVVA